MTCRHLVKRLLAFASGELPAAEHTRCRDHVRRCTSCAAFAESYLVTVRMARTLAGTDLPCDVAARLLTGLAERLGRRVQAPKGEGEGDPGLR